MDNGYKIANATGSVNNGAKTATILACPANGKILVVGGGLSATVAAAGGGGLVQLVEVTTGTVLVSIAVNATQYIPLYFGEVGLPLTTNNSLQLKVTGAASTEATVSAALTCYTNA